MIKSYFFLAILFILVACSDNNTNQPSNSNDIPKITSIAPVSGYVGTTITINGDNFGIVQGTSFVKFGAVAVNSSEILSWSDTKIQFKVGSALPGVYKILVTVNNQESNSVDFTVMQIPSGAPEISSLSKSTATSGETVKIMGLNFGSTQNGSYVEFKGIKATSYPRWLDNEIIAIVPDDAETGDIIVWVNSVPSNGKPLTIQPKFKLLTMVTVPAGTFQMGGNQLDEWDNKPVHSVTISKNFDISITEITQKEWKSVMDGSNPSQVTDTGDYKPVQQVTFKRAIEFCNRLSDMEGLPRVYQINGDEITWIAGSKGYRLPTEAEWEYACRAGNNNNYTDSEILEMSWIADNSGGRIHDVKLRKPNALGIYDMLGNVAEWCWDEYTDDYYSNSPSTDPTGPATDVNDRITRGGSISNGLTKCNSNIRSSMPGTNDVYNYDLGFRVVRNK